MKICSKCGENKSLLEFCKRAASRDGLAHRCKKCHFEYCKKWKSLNRDRKNANERAWRARNRDHYRAMAKARRERNSEHIALYNRARSASPEAVLQRAEYYRAHPHVIRAKGIAQRAMKKGLIKKMPCEVCGNPKSEKHHDDYTKPLSVRWLCRSHHKIWHYQNEPIAA